MNTISTKNNKNLDKRFNDFLNFKNDDDELRYETDIIHMNIVFKIIELMKMKGISRAELANQLKTSKSYITQLLSGDKYFNPKLLAKIQRIFKGKFTFGFQYINNFENENVKLPKELDNIFELYNTDEIEKICNQMKKSNKGKIMIIKEKINETETIIQ